MKSIHCHFALFTTAFCLSFVTQANASDPAFDEVDFVGDVHDANVEKKLPICQQFLEAMKTPENKKILANIHSAPEFVFPKPYDDFVSYSWKKISPKEALAVATNSDSIFSKKTEFGRKAKNRVFAQKAEFDFNGDGHMETMIRFLKPQENSWVCTPASDSVDSLPKSISWRLDQVCNIFSYKGRAYVYDMLGSNIYIRESLNHSISPITAQDDRPLCSYIRHFK